MNSEIDVLDRTPSLATCALATLAAACGPIATLRPASGLMPGRSLEVGAGAAMVTARPYVDESAAGAGQIWVTGDVGRWSSVSAISAFDDDAAGIGGAFRLNLLRFDRFAGGIECELGYVWGGLSLPFAARLFDQTWLYSAPRLGTWGIDPTFGVPIGLSARLYEGSVLRAEWQRSWQDFKYYNRRDHFAAGFAHQF